MTSILEAKLTTEIRYSTVAMVTDYDCWHPDHDEVDVSGDPNFNEKCSECTKMIKEIIKTFKEHSVKKILLMIV